MEPTMNVWTHRLRSARCRLAALAAGVLLAVLPASAMAAEESGGISALGFNLPGLIAQLINFAILLILLRLFLFGPIMNMLDERKRRIEEGLVKSEEAASQAEASEQQSQQVLAEARAEAQRLLAGAQESAASLRAELEEQARANAERIRTDAQASIQAERDQAIQALRAEFADLTITAAERVVGQSLDRAAHQRLIDETLVESSFGQNGNN
jgi:F-type H+-transporting ATPase subunit b